MKGKAIKKPIPVDFFEYTGSWIDLYNWVTEELNEPFEEWFILSVPVDNDRPPTLYGKTCAGNVYGIHSNMVILHGGPGDFYPHDIEKFRRNYNIVR